MWQTLGPRQHLEACTVALDRSQHFVRHVHVGAALCIAPRHAVESKTKIDSSVILDLTG